MQYLTHLAVCRRLRLPLAVLAMAFLSACIVVPIPASRESSMVANGSCGEQMGAEVDRTVEPGGLDQALMARAIRIGINRERCQRSLVPLGEASSATRAATRYAQTMARYGFLAHRSPVQGAETFSKRLAAEHARYRMAGENLARTPLYALGQKPFVVVDGGRCLFSRTNGQPIPKRSYRVLGDHLVAMWMGSAEHRKNMLHPEFRRVGLGVGIRPETGTCGEVFAAAVFLG